MQTAELIDTCIARKPDCPQCAQLTPRHGPEKRCDAICDIEQGLRNDHGPHSHELENVRHECGAMLHDWKGGQFETRRTCPYHCCVMFFCPGCDRYTSGWGAIACPCSNGRGGHGTYGELRRPSLARLRKTRRTYRGWRR